jgi:hypothetical protein
VAGGVSARRRGLAIAAAVTLPLIMPACEFWVVRTGGAITAAQVVAGVVLSPVALLVAFGLVGQPWRGVRSALVAVGAGAVGLLIVAAFITATAGAYYGPGLGLVFGVLFGYPAGIWLVGLKAAWELRGVQTTTTTPP